MKERPTSKGMLVLPLLAGAVLALGAQRWQAARTATPLEAKPTRIDLGRVAEGGIATGTFRLMNPTRATVRIARIETSCGCTSVTQLDSLAPGATADLKVAVATAGKRGAFREFVTVRFADESRTPLVVPVDAATGIPVAASNRPEEPLDGCVAPAQENQR